MNRSALALASFFLLAAPPAHSTLPAQGRGTDVVLLVDRSKSLVQVDPDDVLTRRAARLIVDTVAATSVLSGGPVRLAVAEFGEEVRQLRPLTPLRGPLEIGGSDIRYERTDFLPSLKFAEQVLVAGATNNRRLIFLLTDGLPALGAESPSREELAAGGLGSLIAGLKGNGAELFLVAIHAPPQTARDWRPLLAEGHYLQLHTESDFARIGVQLLNELTGRRLRSQLAEPGEMILSLSLPQESSGPPVLLLALKGSSLARLSVFDPQGQPWPPSLGSPDAPYEFFLLRGGSPGPWRFVVRGDVEWVGVQEAAGTAAPNTQGPGSPVPAALLPMGVGLLVVWLLPFVLGYWIGRENEQAPEATEGERAAPAEVGEERTTPAEVVDVEALSREADQLVREKRWQDAERILSSALTAVHTKASVARLTGRDILRKMLGMYPDQINEQKRILHEQLHAEPAREALQTVAQILQDRWKAKPDLFFSEFYYFRDTSRGPALIAELSQLDSGRDDLGHFLRKVATQSDRLQLWMDDER